MSPAAAAAIDTYRAANRRLLENARAAANSGRPTLAEYLRDKARLALRAAEDEEIDKPPAGLSK